LESSVSVVLGLGYFDVVVVESGLPSDLNTAISLRQDNLIEDSGWKAYGGRKERCTSS
jgi:hypothetical protein